MDLKMWECERETRTEEEQNNEVDICILTIVLTLCTFLLMVSLKKLLVEQWRSWVFLVLNLILLAIMFMSMKPNFWGSQSSENGETIVGEEVKSDKKVKENNEEGSKENIKKSQCWGSSSSNSTNVSVNVDAENEIIDEDLDLDLDLDEEEEEEEQVLVLSKEELNERVEAFIAMFRKHLISDVKESEEFRFSKNANFAAKIEVPCC